MRVSMKYLDFMMYGKISFDRQSGFATTAPARITAIEIEGLRRTRRETVLLLARVREGDPWREGLDAEARQTLLNIDPHLGGTRFQLFGTFNHTDARLSVWDADEEIGSYRSRATGSTLSLGYRFAPHTLIFLGLRLTEDRVAPFLASSEDLALAGRVSKESIDFLTRQLRAWELHPSSRIVRQIG